MPSVRNVQYVFAYECRASRAYRDHDDDDDDGYGRLNFNPVSSVDPTCLRNGYVLISYLKLMPGLILYIQLKNVSD